MPSPSTSLATQRPELATLVELDLQATHSGFIGHQLYPVFPVPVQAGAFGRIPLNELMQSGKTARAPASTYERDDFNFIPDSYATMEHGREAVIDDRERAMYMSYLDSDAVATVRAVDKVLRAAEVRIRDNFVAATASFTQGVSAGAWSVSTSDPITDVSTAVMAVRRTGMEPNALQMEWEAYKYLRDCPQLIDRVKHQGFIDARARTVNLAAMASFFDLDYIIVSGAGNMLNTANQGQSSASLTELWDKTEARVCRVATSNDHREPCVGRTYNWAGDESMINGTVESYRDETVRADVVRVRHDVDEKSMYPECCQTITGVLA